MKNLSFFILVFFLSFLSPAFAAYDNLYLVGNATEAGWGSGCRYPDGKAGAWYLYVDRNFIGL